MYLCACVDSKLYVYVYIGGVDVPGGAQWMQQVPAHQGMHAKLLETERTDLRRACMPHAHRRLIRGAVATARGGIL